MPVCHDTALAKCRTGGNDDGFSGKYSAIRQEKGGLVIADLKGPGVVNRIWTPTPTADSIRFYFDGESKPSIALPFIELFTGKTFPFLSPLSGNQLGGYYCYLPIPYEKSLKIVYSGQQMRFHQIQYRTVGKEQKVKSFSAEMVRSHQLIIDNIAGVWNKQVSPLTSHGNTVQTKKINVTLLPGEEQRIFSADDGGRIVGIELAAGNLSASYRKIMLTARWDNESINAIDVPLHDFFGYAFGKPSMRSLMLGANSDLLYSYLPMPYDKTADIRLRYDKEKGGSEETRVSGTIYYTAEKRDVNNEGKLYVQSRRQYNIPSGTSHLIADVKGRGHYVGTILVTQGLEEGSTWYFEGDDRAIIDGKLRLHGTGSEDYFNGGWYAVIDRWDKGLSLPIHGSLAYDMMTSRTGGYRFYLSDKLNFNSDFQLSIEHQPDKENNVKTDYTSLGFFYAQDPKFKNTSLILDDKTKTIPVCHKLTAQGMFYSLYWLASASYEDPAIVFSMKQSDAWFAKIDPDAIPMAQISLNSLDNGKYKVFIEYSVGADSGPFSLWQRSTKISDWITGKDQVEKAPQTIYAGDIEITDEQKTITIRKQSPDTTVRIFNFVFEKIE